MVFPDMIAWSRIKSLPFLFSCFAGLDTFEIFQLFDEKSSLFFSFVVAPAAMAVKPEQIWTDYVQTGLGLIITVFGAVISLLAYLSYVISILPYLALPGKLQL